MMASTLTRCFGAYELTHLNKIFFVFAAGAQISMKIILKWLI